jgi:hypothetical protein
VVKRCTIVWKRKRSAAVAKLLLVQLREAAVDVLALHEGQHLLDADEVLVVLDPQALQAASSSSSSFWISAGVMAPRPPGKMVP